MRASGVQAAREHVHRACRATVLAVSPLALDVHGDDLTLYADDVDFSQDVMRYDASEGLAVDDELVLLEVADGEWVAVTVISDAAVTPAGGTGGTGSSSPASTAALGIVRLSHAPAVPASPVVVEDADPRNADARTPSGAAGGHLGGTYPNPTVVLVNGRAVSAVVFTDDSRLSDARTPTAHATTHKSGGVDAIRLDELAAPSAVVNLNSQRITSLGTPSAAGDAIRNDDSRLGDARTPTTHASTHESGGADAIRLDQLAAPTAPVSANSQRVTNVGAPTASSDAVRNDDSRLSLAFARAFGDGSDGALAFDGTSTVAGLAPSASTYTLNRDLHASSITISAGVTVKTNGARLFCRGNWSNAGTVSFDGANGAATGTAGGSTSLVASTAAGSAGVVGAASAGSNGLYGGVGGAGGAGGTGAGGASAGMASGVTAAQITAALRTLAPALIGGLNYNAAWRPLMGGAGGSGGGGDGTNKGGGGGSGGGVVLIFVGGTFTNTGTISAKGGTGGTPTTGNAGGGGGGGGGSILVYSLSAVTMGTTTVTGGTGGTQAGTGVAGSAGAVGTTLNVVLA